MNNVAVFVDAGFFWAQVEQELAGERLVKLERDRVILDHDKLRQAFVDYLARKFPHLDLLRIYWYDGPNQQGMKTTAHTTLELLDNFKLRLGQRSSNGMQKGVDGLVIADLFTLAHNRTLHTAVLMSGDGDLVPGVMGIQTLGVRVHLLSLGPEGASALALRCEVDSKDHWSGEVIREFARTASSENGVDQAGQDEIIPEPMRVELLELARHVFYQDLDDGMRQTCLDKADLSADADRALLQAARQRFHRYMSNEEKRLLRQLFRDVLQRQVALDGRTESVTVEAVESIEA